MRMRPVFIQTCDPRLYYEMLAVSSATIRKYCEMHGYGYESYVGIKRGTHAWLASFNRIYQFQELISRNISEWVIHVDADAYIVDFQFDLRSYLGNLIDRSAVFVHSGVSDKAWDVNSGVIILNLAHASARRLVDLWLEKFRSITDFELTTASNWFDVKNDQAMLQEILRDNPDLIRSAHFESRDLMNSFQASFIRHHVTEITPNIQRRTVAIRNDTLVQLDDLNNAVETPPPTGDYARLIVAELYRAVLRRAPDASGLLHYSNILRDGSAENLGSVIRALLDSAEYKKLAYSFMGEERSEINELVRTRTGSRVQAGPFSGMKIPDIAARGDGDIAPKLLGVYEQELQPYYLRFSNKEYGAVVDVGCAEGYYAVGAALLFPNLPVFAFDTEQGAREILLETARINGVSSRITIGKFCDGPTLGKLVHKIPNLLAII